MAWLDGWSNRKKITVASADVPSTQTNFPLRVQVLDDADILGEMKADGADIRFTAADGETLLDYNLLAANRLLQRDACWTWYSDPRAVYSSSATSTYIGYTNQDNEFEVGRYNHSSGAWTTFTLGTGATSEDDHNNPALCILADGKIASAYCEHNSANVFFRKTTSAGDISAWDSAVAVSDAESSAYSYTHLYQMSNGDLIVMYRRRISGAERDTRYRVSTDGGASWGTEKRLFFVATERPYFKACQVGDILHFCSTNAQPNEIALGSNDIMHYYMDYNDGTPQFYESDGTLIGGEGDLPLTPADVTVAFDATASGDNAWNWGIAADGSGNVAIVYTLSDASQVANASPRLGQYRYAYWNGSAWSNNDIASTGAPIHDPRREPYYYAGICIDPDDISRVYYCRHVDGVTQLFEATTANSGTSWTETQRTTSKGGKRARPFAIKSPNSDCKVVMWNGYYADYFNWDTSLESWPTQLGPVLTLEADVEIPSLSSSADTEIYLYYGNSSATDASSEANTYPDLIDAWHGSVEYQQVNSVDLASKTALTIEAVYKAKAFNNSNDEALSSNWTGTPTDAQYLMRFANTTNSPLEFFINSSGGSVGTTFSDLTPTAGVVQHAAAVLDGGSTAVRGYLAGTASSTTGTASAMDSSASSLGVVNGNAVFSDTQSFDGTVRLVRIWDKVQSADWLSIMADSMADPDGFYTLGDEESPPAEDLTVQVQSDGTIRIISTRASGLWGDDITVDETKLTMISQAGSGARSVSSVGAIQGEGGSAAQIIVTPSPLLYSSGNGDITIEIAAGLFTDENGVSTAAFDSFEQGDNSSTQEPSSGTGGGGAKRSRCRSRARSTDPGAYL